MGSIRLQAALLGLCAAVSAAGVTPARGAGALLQGQAAHRPDQLRGRRAGRYREPDLREVSRPHIDGAPNVIVQNMDGAGGLIGAQYLGEIAPKDGTVLGALTGTAWIYASDPAAGASTSAITSSSPRSPSTTIHFVRTDVAPGIKKPD